VRPKSGLPKRKSLRRLPQFDFGFRNNPKLFSSLNSVLLGKTPTKNVVTAVSFFAGCGGLDLGLLGGFQFHGTYYPPLPFNILAAYDNDIGAVETYKLNLADHIHHQDLTKIDMKNIPAADVLFGGFPCQDFSSCGHKRGFAGERGQLYKVMVEYMKTHQPKLVIGENVPLLGGMKGGSLLDKIIADLTDVGYTVKCWFLNCPDYGLPASRRRIIITCIRNDLNGLIQSPVPTHVFKPVTIDEALDDLISIIDESIPNQSQYFVATKATAGAGQGDQVSDRGRVAYAVRANAKARIHFHYELERRLTVRECARLQSFPDEFVFPHSTGGNMMVIGNAIPPIIGHHIGRSVVEFFQSLDVENQNVRVA
jgi:DNA (cytosine-5)-methyltransferase 1